MAGSRAYPLAFQLIGVEADRSRWLTFHVTRFDRVSFLGHPTFLIRSGVSSHVESFPSSSISGPGGVGRRRRHDPADARVVLARQRVAFECRLT
ncbi:MAG: hypothetical protein R3B96_11760 [Pirellulaceae bacterium]